jgi:membrane protease YdiL (CAAX protease family)
MTASVTLPRRRPSQVLRMVALVALLLDLTAVRLHGEPLPRLVISTLMILIALGAGATRQDLGLVTTWTRPSLWTAITFFVLEATIVASRWRSYAFGLEPSWTFVQGAVALAIVAPLVEETVYRSILCGALLRGSRSAVRVAVSAGASMTLGFLQGGLQPEEVIGAFALSWLFVSSRTIWLPLTVHIVAAAVPLFINLVLWSACGGILCR